MRAHLRPAIATLAAFTLITGVGYPLVVTAIAQTAFAAQANGSIARQAGRIVGSTLVGQSFVDPGYFWSRPSATTPAPYNAGASGGSNLGPSNAALRDAVRARIASLHAADPQNAAPVPVDLVTASASGLDPHISPSAAMYQVARVARERRVSSAQIATLVQSHIEPRALGILGEPVVNVLRLNQALDTAHPRR